MKSKPKKLGLFMLIALVCGNMIGSGVFLLPSSLAALGSISLWSWAVTGFGALILALLFAKMSVLVPYSGGPFAYAYAAFGEFIGFQTAFNYWLALWIGNAAIAVAFVGYLQVFFPILQSSLYSCITAIALVWGLTFFNLLGAHKAGVLQLITTLLKLVPLLIVGLFGWFYFHPSYLTDYKNLTGHSNFSVISSGALLTLWAFIGLESATVPAGEVENPKRNIPLATIVGVLLTIFIYISCSIAIMGMIKASTLQYSTAPFADAAQIIFGPLGKSLVAIGAIIACFGTLNGWILLQGQITKAAADRGQFPAIFGKINRFNSNHWGQIFTSILISVLLLMTANKGLINQFNFTILLASILSAVPYLYTALATIITIKRSKTMVKNSTLYITIAPLGAIYTIWAIFSAGQEIVYYLMLLLTASPLLYTWSKSLKKLDAKTKNRLKVTINSTEFSAIEELSS